MIKSRALILTLASFIYGANAGNENIMIHSGTAEEVAQEPLRFPRGNGNIIKYVGDGDNVSGFTFGYPEDNFDPRNIMCAQSFMTPDADVRTTKVFFALYTAEPGLADNIDGNVSINYDSNGKPGSVVDNAKATFSMIGLPESPNYELRQVSIEANLMAGEKYWLKFFSTNASQQNPGYAWVLGRYPGNFEDGEAVFGTRGEGWDPPSCGTCPKGDAFFAIKTELL